MQNGICEPLLTILNHQGEDIERELQAHWSNPRVISPACDTPRWDWPDQVDVVLTTTNGWTSAPAQPTRSFRNVKWVQLDSVGIDPYPAWLLEAPIVSNARGSNAIPLAEYAMAAILGFEKRYGEVQVRGAEQWQHFTMGQVENRMLGLAGYGAVGQAIAHRARAFGMRVAAFKRTPWKEVPPGLFTVDSIGELASISDHLVLACPLTEATRNMIDSRVLASARRGLHLVNIARGGLIEESGLLKALDDGVVAGATLDVTAPEPLPPGHSFYSHSKIRLTPHIAYEGANNTTRMRRIVLENLSALLRGEPLQNVIDLRRGY